MAKKKGQIDNGEEFLKLFPERSDLNDRDNMLRKKFYEFKASIKYNYVSADIKISLNRTIASVKSRKSDLLKGYADILNYEKSLIRFEKQLMFAIKGTEKESKFVGLEKVDDLEKELLELHSDILAKLLLKIINKTKIFLSNEDLKGELDIINCINTHQSLKKNFQKNFQSYSLPDRRHIGNALIHLRKPKSDQDSNTKRAIENYCKKVLKLKDFMEK